MDFRPDRDAHLAEKKRRYVRKKKRNKKVIIVLACLAIVVLWCTVAFFACRETNKYLPSKETPEKTEAVTTVATSAVQSEREPEIPAPPKGETVDISISPSDVHKGTLILVSEVSERPFDFEQQGSLVTLYGNKSASYSVSSSLHKLDSEAFLAAEAMFNDFFLQTGKANYQITQAYRSMEEQQAVYDSFLEKNGTEQVDMLVVKPGYSDHHTGYSFDLNVFDGQNSYNLKQAGAKDADYSWIYDHAHEYGFVLRYPEEKAQVTGISSDQWHFRYVGKGHAAYMKENNLTLEEYIYLIYKYQFGKDHLRFEYDGVRYDVSFLKVDANAQTVVIPVSKGATCIISGDNSDGVIITQVY